VEDTVSILRGLKERYEVHHGVRITDNAIVAAAHMANKYISDRFMPDKAIDLIDEATAKIRMEIDSLPTELDELERRITHLEIDRQALKKEKDEASKQRLAKLEEELANLKEQSSAMRVAWQNEKDVIQNSRHIKEQIEEAKLEMTQAERLGDLTKASELKYGKLVELESSLKNANAKLEELQQTKRILKEEVDEEDIAVYA